MQSQKLLAQLQKSANEQKICGAVGKHVKAKKETKRAHARKTNRNSGIPEKA